MIMVYDLDIKTMVITQSVYVILCYWLLQNIVFLEKKTEASGNILWEHATGQDIQKH